MKNYTVKNMIGHSGNEVKNQFVITDSINHKRIFQSYETVIAEIDTNTDKITLDTNALNYSTTTNKYLYLFLGMKRKDIEKNGDITYDNLN